MVADRVAADQAAAMVAVPAADALSQPWLVPRNRPVSNMVQQNSEKNIVQSKWNASSKDKYENRPLRFVWQNPTVSRFINNHYLARCPQNHELAFNNHKKD